MRTTLLVLIAMISGICFAQNKQVLYNFNGIPQSGLTNPGADIAYKWYFGVPLLSGISANVGSSGFSAYDLFATNGVDFNTKLRNVIFSSSRNDKVTVNEQLNIFDAGFKIGGWQGTSYVSFGMYQEFDFLSYVPKDIAILALDGNSNYLGKSFNLGDVNIQAEMLTVFHLGYHKKVSESLILGARGKIYSSIYNATSAKNSGYIYTIPSSQSTIYDQVIEANLELKTSGIAKYDDKNYTPDVAKDITKRAFLGGNLGLGFDIGLTYYPQKNIQFTASLLDIGFIRHSKEVETFRMKGTYNYQGIHPDFLTGNGTNNISQEFQDAIPLDTLYKKYTTWRPAKINASLQYSFGEDKADDCVCTGQNSEIKYKNAVGGQLFMRTTPRTPMVALTGFYTRQLLKGVALKATYTIDSYSFTNIGLGLSSKIGLFHFYVLADNILEYRNISKANSASFQLGFNFILKDSSDPY